MENLRVNYKDRQIQISSPNPFLDGQRHTMVFFEASFVYIHVCLYVSFSARLCYFLSAIPFKSLADTETTSFVDKIQKQTVP